MSLTVNHCDKYNVHRIYQGSDPLFAGSFGHKENRNANSLFFKLDEFDTLYCHNVPLKEGEQIFRCYTEMTKSYGIKYFVKINFEKNLVYYLQDKAMEEDKVIFETRGLKFTYLNIFK